MTPRLADKKRAVNIAREIETEVSPYLFTVACINMALGITVALAMRENYNPAVFAIGPRCAGALRASKLC